MIKIIKKILDKYSVTPKFFPIRLSDNEKKLFLKYIIKSKNYLEFGSGGSTFLSLICSETLVVTVDSDSNWINYLRKWQIIKNAEKKGILLFWHANIGKVGELGVPINNDLKSTFPLYSSSIFNENKGFDLVFVDGRFRVACVLATIINCKVDTIIIVHDFNNREEYSPILSFLDIMETIETMTVFKIKNQNDISKIISIYDKYKYISD